jgi:hypothetical protein
MQLTRPYAQTLAIAHAAQRAASQCAQQDPQHATTLLELEREARCLVANAWRGWSHYEWADLRSLQRRATNLNVATGGMAEPQPPA